MLNPEEISPDEDLVNSWRLAQGDLEVAKNARGKICRAIPARLTIVKELIRRGIFPFHYEVYGVGFLELRAAFRTPWAVRSAAVLMEQWGVGVSIGRADEVYENICRKMGKWRINVVEFVATEEKDAECLEHHVWYKECFERLVGIMDEERSRIFNEKEK